MQVDIKLSNAKVYNMHRAEVILGEKFSLIADFEGERKWFANNDKVLSLEAVGNKADIEATAVGTSQILIMNSGFRIAKKITITVVEAITDVANDLGVTADPPELK